MRWPKAGELVSLVYNKDGQVYPGKVISASGNQAILKMNSGGTKKIYCTLGAIWFDFGDFKHSDPFTLNYEDNLG